MEPFSDFLDYVAKNADEVMFDSTSFTNFYTEGLTLTQEDIVLIATIADKVTKFNLRQYHSWLHSIE